MVAGQPSRTLGPSVGRFFASNLRFEMGLDKGMPFVLEPWQQDIIDLIYEVDEDGRRMWREVLLGIPRGNGKSPLCAGIGLYELLKRRNAPIILCAAAAKKQAGIVHGFAYDFVHGGPLADYVSLPRVKKALGPMLSPRNSGVLEVVTADGDLQQGLIPDVVIEDEPHTFTTGKQQSLHFALSTTMHKRADSVMVLITTAGAHKQTLLGELFDAKVARAELEYRYDKCMMIGRDYEARSLLIWYGAPEDADVSDPAVWRACNPATWITDESLLLAARREPESVFRRFYLNQWVLGADAAIQPAAWDACEGTAGVPEGADIWAGVDLGERRDHSAVSIVYPLDFPHTGTPWRSRLVMRTRVFDPGVENVRTLIPLVEGEIRRLADTYVLRAVAFDAWQVRDLAGRLAAEGLRMMEVPQNDSHMVPACQSFFDLISSQTLMHDGDKTHREHILNAASKTTSRGGWRLVKPLGKGNRIDEKRKVDAAIADVMACAAYQSDNKPGSAPWAETW